MSQLPAPGWCVSPKPAIRGTRVSEGLCISGRRGMAGHSLCAWCQLLEGSECLCLLQTCCVWQAWEVFVFAGHLQAGTVGDRGTLGPDWVVRQAKCPCWYFEGHASVVCLWDKCVSAVCLQ